MKKVSTSSSSRLLAVTPSSFDEFQSSSTSYTADNTRSSEKDNKSVGSRKLGVASLQFALKKLESEQQLLRQKTTETWKSVKRNKFDPIYWPPFIHQHSSEDVGTRTTTTMATGELSESCSASSNLAGLQFNNNRLSQKRLLLDQHPKHNPIFRIGPPPLDCKSNSGRSDRSAFAKMSSIDSSISPYGVVGDGGIGCREVATDSDRPVSSVLFPSMRFLLAVLLCCCYITISISSSNIAVALICMIKCPIHGYTGNLEWQSDQEGLVLAAQNAGSLLILLTGTYADRINGKWMVGASLSLCLVGNLMMSLKAQDNFWFAVSARLAVGASDAFMSPAINSLITRWFPHTERAAAVGIITGGRQIGTLFILPTAGYLCTRTDLDGGWPAIFYLSGLISGLVFIFWLPMGADKPAKQYCISNRERLFIESRIACESIGKRNVARRVPWRDLLRSTPLWVGVFSLICHEYPLVIVLQFLPNYMRDVLEFAPTKNGFLSALPILFLFISKTASSTLSSWMSTRTSYNSTTVCKVFNGIASLGLSLSIFAVSRFGKEQAHLAIISLCLATTFAGLHTPGVQTALLQLAPPFSGIVTGISFFSVAWFSIGNKILTKWIVQQGEQEEWAIVFYISSAVAALPVVFFSLWGTDQRQWWAAPAPMAKASTGSASAISRQCLCSAGKTMPLSHQGSMCSNSSSNDSRCSDEATINYGLNWKPKK